MTTEQLKQLRAELTLDEGLRLRPYHCTAGYLTIGVGHNLDAKGISPAVSRLMLDEDIEECLTDLETFPWFRRMDAGRQRAMVNMRFQLGAVGFRGFKKMLAALDRDDYLTASRKGLQSKWARTDTPVRARRVMALLRDGDAAA